MKLETVFGSLMVFIGIVIMLVAITLSVVLTTPMLQQVTSNMFLVGIFFTPPFFTVGGLVLILIGKMHADSERRGLLGKT